jgi:hypothetical protein
VETGRSVSILRAQHVPEDRVDRFHVARVRDGKTTAPAAIPAPVDCPVQGRPDSNLVRELRWYLEEFLGYPFPPETEHAERVLDALHKWGRDAFDALFDNRQGADFLREAQQGQGYEPLNLQISSDDPRVLAWPWEALEDSHAGLLARPAESNAVSTKLLTRARWTSRCRATGSTPCWSRRDPTRETCGSARSPARLSS